MQLLYSLSDIEKCPFRVPKIYAIENTLELRNPLGYLNALVSVFHNIPNLSQENPICHNVHSQYNAA